MNNMMPTTPIFSRDPVIVILQLKTEVLVDSEWVAINRIDIKADDIFRTYQGTPEQEYTALKDIHGFSAWAAIEEPQSHLGMLAVRARGIKNYPVVIEDDPE